MSALPCGKCGTLRKIEQVTTPSGFENPPCYNCGDPGFTQPYEPEALDAKNTDELPRRET